jgi:hypothetical protein
MYHNVVKIDLEIVRKELSPEEKNIEYLTICDKGAKCNRFDIHVSINN